MFKYDSADVKDIIYIRVVLLKKKKNSKSMILNRKLKLSHILKETE